MTEEIFYTYKGAAKRVRRDERTIRRWAHEPDGKAMPTRLDDSGRRVVAHRDLLAKLREKLANNPVHQQRGRAMRDATRESGA